MSCEFWRHSCEWCTGIVHNIQYAGKLLVKFDEDNFNRLILLIKVYIYLFKAVVVVIGGEIFDVDVVRNVIFHLFIKYM